MVAIHNQLAFERHAWTRYRLHHRSLNLHYVNWSRIGVLSVLVAFWCAAGMAAFRLL